MNLGGTEPAGHLLPTLGNKDSPWKARAASTPTPCTPRHQHGPSSELTWGLHLDFQVCAFQALIPTVHLMVAPESPSEEGGAASASAKSLGVTQPPGEQVEAAPYATRTLRLREGSCLGPQGHRATGPRHPAGSCAVRALLLLGPAQARRRARPETASTERQ